MKSTVALKTNSGKKRILSFDILRGLFLVIILINHIELYPSFFDYFTGRGRLLVSAAEGFFFMSGLLVGIVYKRRIHLGMKFIFKKMWTRAAELYLGSVVLTLLFTAAAIFFNHPSIKDGLYSVIDWPHIIKETFLMRYGFGWADFLDRFAILMFMAPFGFYLLSKKKWWLFAAASLAAWGFRSNNFTLSWQIIFNLGMLIGFYWEEITNRFRALSAPTKSRLKTAVVSTAIITFVLSYASVYVLSELNYHWYNLSAGWLNFTHQWNSVNEYIWLYAQKWTMGPLRILLFLIWFTALFLWVEKHYRGINRLTCNYLVVLGQNSFFVYVAHAFIVFIFKLFIPHTTTFVQNFIITAAALGLLVLETYVYLNIRRSISERTTNSTNKNLKYLKAKPAES